MANGSAAIEKAFPKWTQFMVTATKKAKVKAAKTGHDYSS